MFIEKLKSENALIFGLLFCALIIFNGAAFATSQIPANKYFVIINGDYYGPADLFTLLKWHLQKRISLDDVLEETDTKKQFKAREILTQSQPSKETIQTAPVTKSFEAQPQIKNKRRNSISLGYSKRIKTDIKESAVFKSADYKYSSLNFNIEKEFENNFALLSAVDISETKNNAGSKDIMFGGRYYFARPAQLRIYLGANAGLGNIKAGGKSDYSAVAAIEAGAKFYITKNLFLDFNSRYKHFSKFYYYSDWPDKLKFGGISVYFNIGWLFNK